METVWTDIVGGDIETVRIEQEREGKLEGYGREDIETSGGEAHRQLKREKQGEEKEQGEGRGKEWKGSRRDTSGEEVNID